MIETKTDSKGFVKEYLASKGLKIKKLKIITDEKPYLIIAEISNRISTGKAVNLSIELMERLKETFKEDYLIDVIPEL